MQQKLIFNPKGTDTKETRRLIGGDTTNLMNLNDVKFQWAVVLGKQMLDNFWRPEKADMTEDIQEYPRLTESERRAYDGIVSFLTFLDSIQTYNIPHIADYITAPEVAHALAYHTFQEALHSYSYQYIIESVIEPERRNKVYDFWREDETLLARNEYIAGIYQQFMDERSEENFIKVLIANYLLEGLYFYNGFNFFYLLDSRHLMSGTADVIRWINRDELTHCVLFERILSELLPKQMHSVAYEMFEAAVEQETNWAVHIIGDNILGMDSESIGMYTRHLGNVRLMKLGLDRIFGDTSNPFKHLERLADTGSGVEIKGNFFEATLTSYNMAEAVTDDW